MKYIGIYIYLFFLLYGPKLFGYVDTSILANAAALFFLSNLSLKLTPILNILALWILFIIACYMGVAIYYDTVDIVFLGRLIRSLVSFFCVYGFCSYYANEPLENKLNWITNVLLIHAIIVIVSAVFFIELQEYLSIISDYNKRPRLFRSTGLMAGFDMAGLICNVGVVTVLIKKKFNLILFLIFFTAVIFTSRFSILTLFCVLILYIIAIRTDGGIFKFTCVLLTLLPIGLVGFILFVLTTSGIFFDMDIPLLKTVSSLFTEISWTYAQTDLSETTKTQLVFPDSFFTFLFGLGFYGGGDPGYVRIINCVGFLGLCSMMLWHVYLFYAFFYTNSLVLSCKKQKIFLGFFFIAVLIFLNFKNSYFYTGTFFELILYLCYNYMLSKKQIKNEDAKI